MHCPNVWPRTATPPGTYCVCAMITTSVIPGIAFTCARFLTDSAVPLIVGGLQIRQHAGVGLTVRGAWAPHHLKRIDCVDALSECLAAHGDATWHVLRVRDDHHVGDSGHRLHLREVLDRQRRPVDRRRTSDPPARGRRTYRPRSLGSTPPEAHRLRRCTVRMSGRARRRHLARTACAR